MNKTTLKKIVIRDLEKIVEELKDNGEEHQTLETMLKDLENDIKQKGTNWLIKHNIITQLNLIKRYLKRFINNRQIGEDVYWFLIDFENIIEEYENN